MDPVGGAANRDGSLDERDLIDREEVAGSAAPEFEEILVDGDPPLSRPSTRQGHFASPEVAPAGGCLLIHRTAGVDLA